MTFNWYKIVLKAPGIKYGRKLLLKGVPEIVE